jgi:hypothetical protein
MTFPLLVLAWLAGVVLGMQLIAAAYTILDLRYRPELVWRTLLLRLGGWGFVAVACYQIAPDFLQGSLTSGIRFICGLELLIIVLAAVAPTLLARLEQHHYQRFLRSLNKQARVLPRT